MGPPNPPGPRITVEIAPDRMAAWVTVGPGPPLGPEDLTRALAAAKVVAGLDEAALARIGAELSSPAFAERRAPVALGRPMQPGRDAAFEPAFEPGLLAGTLREDGSIDYHERGLLKPVAAGDFLGKLVAALPGSPTVRVDGSQEPPPPVRGLKVNLGAGVERREPGALHAARAGAVLYTGDALDVVTHHEHKGNVDLRSGDLAMEGSLLVTGDVERGFAVRASGDVDVQGSVQSGTVHAGGNLTIRQGVRGGDAGVVSADGSLSVRHADGATLLGGTTLQVEDAIASELRAVRIVVTRRMRGGTAIAEESVVVGEVGAHGGGADTTLTAGEPLERPVLDVQRAIAARKALRMAERRGRGDGDRIKGGKLGRAVAALDASEIARRAERARRRESLKLAAQIRVQGDLHPVVTVKVGDVALVVEQPARGVAFSLDPELGNIRMERLSK